MLVTIARAVYLDPQYFGTQGIPLGAVPAQILDHQCAASQVLCAQERTYRRWLRLQSAEAASRLASTVAGPQCHAVRF